MNPLTFVVIAEVSLKFLTMIAFSAAQSSAQSFIHNAILFIDTSDYARYDQPHWLIRMPYLSTIASNDAQSLHLYCLNLKIIQI